MHAKLSTRPHIDAGAAVPFLFGRRTFVRALLSLLFVEMVAMAGEWLLHQTVYLLAYRGQFGAVMQASAHRGYISGFGEGVVFFGLFFALAMVLFRWRVHVLHDRLSGSLPERIASRLPATARPLRPGRILATAVVLFVFQAAVFGIQENWETVNATAQFAGVTVFFAGWHAIVLPIDLVVATCLSFILWCATTFVRDNALAVALATVLAVLLRKWLPCASDAPSTDTPTLATNRFASRQRPRSPPLLA